MATPEELQAKALRDLEQRLGGVFEGVENLSDALRDVYGPTEKLSTTLNRSNSVMSRSNSLFAEAARISRRVGQVRHDALIDELKILAEAKSLAGEGSKEWDKFGDSVKDKLREIADEESAMRVRGARSLANFSGSIFSLGASTDSFVGKTVNAGIAIKAGWGAAIAGVIGVARTFGKVLPPSHAKGIVVALAGGGAALENFIKRTEEAQQVARAFGGSVVQSGVSLGKFGAIAKNTIKVMAPLNVQIEEMAVVSNLLARSYGISSGAAMRFGASLEEYVANSQASIVQTIAMGKSVGLTQEEIGRFVGVVGVLGEDLGNVNQVFATVGVQAERVGMYVGDLVRSVSSLGSANIFVNNAVSRTTSSLTKFFESVKTAQSGLLTGANNLAVAARATEAIADASSRMDLASMLAFGSGLDGMVGGIDDKALEKAMGMDPVERFGEMMRKIDSLVMEPNKRMITRTVAAQALGGISDPRTAYAAALGRFDKQARSQTEETALQKDALKYGTDQLKFARDTATLLGSIDKTLTRMLQAGAQIPGGSIWDRSGAGRPTQPGMATSAAGGTPQ